MNDIVEEDLGERVIQIVDQVGSTIGPPLVVASSYFSVQWLINPGIWGSTVEQVADTTSEDQA